MKFMDNPWKTAEDAIFKALCEGTGSVAKENAFIGYLPPVPNVWAIKFGGGGDVRNTWTAQIFELHMDSDIEGLFMERETAQQFALKVLQCLPILRIANVQVFRLREGGMPDIKLFPVTFANEDRERFVWSVTMGCDFVFNTVDRANVSPGV